MIPICAHTLLLALCVLVAQGPVLSQSAARGRILGVFDELTFQPLEGADVIDLATGTRATTSATGTISLAWLSPGTNLLEIRKLGYATKLQPVSVSATDTVSVTVVLTALTQTLPTLVTTARAAGDTVRKLELRGFYDRRRTTGAPGSAFVTTDKLEKLSLLNDLPTITGRGLCLENFYIDGVRVLVPTLQDQAMPGRRSRVIVAPPRRNGIDQILTPDQVVGVELYKPADVPAEFDAPVRRGRSCGATLIWTK